MIDIISLMAIATNDQLFDVIDGASVARAAAAVSGDGIMYFLADAQIDIAKCELAKRYGRKDGMSGGCTVPRLREK